MSLDKLPETIDPDLDLDKVKLECEELVKEQAKYSAGAAIVPIPLIDLVVDAGLLTKLLPQISEKFGLLDTSKAMNLNGQGDNSHHLKDRAIAFAGLAFTRGIAKKAMQGFGSRIIAQQVTKFVPFGGQIVSATMGYMIFKKIATDHINECYKTAKRIQQNQHAKTVA